MKKFVIFVDEILNQFESDVEKASEILEKLITDIPLTKFTRRLNFVVKYDTEFHGITITCIELAHMDNRIKSLVKSDDILYSESVFLKAFEDFFTSSKYISKISIEEPEEKAMKKDSCNTFKFYIDPIIPRYEKLLNNKNTSKEKNKEILSK